MCFQVCVIVLRSLQVQSGCPLDEVLRLVNLEEPLLQFVVSSVLQVLPEAKRDLFAAAELVVLLPLRRFLLLLAGGMLEKIHLSQESAEVLAAPHLPYEEQLELPLQVLLLASLRVVELPLLLVLLHLLLRVQVVVLLPLQVVLPQLLLAVLLPLVDLPPQLVLRATGLRLLPEVSYLHRRQIVTVLLPRHAGGALLDFVPQLRPRLAV
jgi:hypothetical protein